MNNLNEFKTETASDEEFRQWKATWDGNSPIPKNIESYFWNVQVKACDRSFNDWITLGKNIIRKTA